MAISNGRRPVAVALTVVDKPREKLRADGEVD